MNTYQDPLVSCQGKQAFVEKSLADKIARMSASRKSDGRRSAYRCKNCHRWHIGTSLSKGR